MLSLIIVTILTSSVDSLNPIAITQQFVLQGMVKKPRHIWYFISATFVVNYITGLLSYYGFLSVFSNAFRFIYDRFFQAIFITLLIVGSVFILCSLYYTFKIKRNLSKQQNDEADKQTIISKIKSVSPVSLVILGTIATISELATALPYFAFLAVMLNHELAPVQLNLILFIYNFIYASPLMIMYLIYKLKQNLFENFYLYIKKQMSKWSAVVVPMVLFSVGIAIIYYAINLN